MVRLEGDRLNGLCSEWVILNEGGWRMKWTWNTGAGETIFEAQRGKTVRMGTIFWVEENHRSVTVGVVIAVVDITLGETDIIVGILVVTVEKGWFVTVVCAWLGEFAVQGGHWTDPTTHVAPGIHGP